MCCFFFRKYPEHLKWFKEFLGYKDVDKTEAPRPHKERSQGELYTEIGKMSELGLPT